MASQPTLLSQHMDAELLDEIEALHFCARQAAQGALAGSHRSLRRGASIEFSEHMVYTPGDDIRHIDWRAYAKTDRFHVKQFEDETHLRIELLFDHSKSMDFGSTKTQDGRVMSKLHFGRILASALSYLALRQGDAMGLVTFAKTITDECPPRASGNHLMEILSRLVRLRAEDTTGIATSLDHYRRARVRPAVVVIISDLFDDDPALIAAFHSLAARHNDVVVLHLLDPAELEFPYENPSTFVSLEDQQQLFVHPRTLKAAFVKEMKRFIEHTEHYLTEVGIHYVPVDISRHPSTVFAEFLDARKRRAG